MSQDALLSRRVFVKSGLAFLSAWTLTIGAVASTASPVLERPGGAGALDHLACACDIPAAVTASEPPLRAVAGGPLPAYVVAPVVQRAYRTALAAPELMAVLPCYCGCVSLPAPHRHLYDCFVTPEGLFEPHAGGCGTCQDEALDAERWAAEGLSPREIRQRIDAAYGASGPPTETPHPEG